MIARSDAVTTTLVVATIMALVAPLWGCCDVDIAIATPTSGTTVRGVRDVSGTATDGGQGHGLKSWNVSLGGTGMDGGLFSETPHTSTWSGSMNTMIVSNGSKILEARAVCNSEPPPDEGTHSFSVTVDNHYLCDVERDSSVTFKYYTSGGAWSELSPSYSCLTTGRTCNDTCAKPPHTGSDHTYCTEADTPPYTGSGINLPTLQNRYGDPTQLSWDQAPDCYYRDKWDEGEGHDDKYYFVVEIGGNVVGKWFVSLADRTAPCGCSRTGVQIHGGKATPNMSEALDPNQVLTSTHGCIRMKNAQLDGLIANYIDPYIARVTYENIHVRTSPN